MKTALDKIIEAVSDGYDVRFRKSSNGLLSVSVIDFRSEPSYHIERMIDEKEARKTRMGIDWIVANEIQVCLNTMEVR